MTPEEALATLGREAILREFARRQLAREQMRARIDAVMPPSPVHDRFERSTSKRKQLRGPNRGGKTKTGARMMIKLMMGCHPTQQMPVPIRARVVCYSFKQSRAVQRALWLFVPKDELHPECTYSPVRGFKHQILRLRNGSECEVTTAKQGTLAHSGDDLDVVWCDEPPAPEHWSELVARLFDRDGLLYLTYTPIGRPCGWLKELCDDGAIEDIAFKLTVEDCPWLTQPKIDDISRAYLPAEWGQRMFGDWEGLTTERVFKSFSDKKHIIERLPDQDYRLYMGWDHGEKSGKEVCIGLAVGEDDGRLYIFGEYVSDGSTKPDQDAAGAAELLARFGWDVLDVLYARGDVNSAGKLSGGQKINDLLAAGFALHRGLSRPPFDIRVPDKGKGSVVAGCRMLNIGFADDKIRVMKSAESLLKSLRHWTGLNDDLKDAIDALRYIGVDFLEDTSQVADRLVITY